MVGSSVYLLFERRFTYFAKGSDFSMIRVLYGLTGILIYYCIGQMTSTSPLFKRREKLQNLKIERIFVLASFIQHTVLAYALIIVQIFLEQLSAESRFVQFAGTLQFNRHSRCYTANGLCYARLINRSTIF
jgi:hypothetical protein